MFANNYYILHRLIRKNSSFGKSRPRNSFPMLYSVTSVLYNLSIIVDYVSARKRKKQRPKHPIKLHIWGEISANGATKLVMFTDIMDCLRSRSVAFH